MRVIAGDYRSRRLQSLRGMDLRPTSDRLRETLFDVLTAGNPSSLEGSVWIDLYAGTGAVGIEALSRGAKMVYFVESSPRAAELIGKNLQSLDVVKGFKIVKQDVTRGLEQLEASSVQTDFVFLDPPYRMEEAYGQTLELLSRSRLMKTGSVIMAEHSKRFELAEIFGTLHRTRKLAQGDAALSFYRLS
jgi:16S rRNA (guanine966-N2)-methyltransferase